MGPEQNCPCETKGAYVWGKVVGDNKSDRLTQRRVLGVMGDMAGKASLSLFLEAVTVRGRRVAPVDGGTH